LSWKLVCLMGKDKELESIRAKKLREMVRRSQGESKQHREEGGIVTLTSSNFYEFIRNATIPVLVDFWAEWCMPCLMMEPVFEGLARDYAGKALFVRLNVDENSTIARQFDIMSIPLFIIFNDGRPIERILGAVGRGVLERALQKYIGI